MFPRTPHVVSSKDRLGPRQPSLVRSRVFSRCGSGVSLLTMTTVVIHGTPVIPWHAGFVRIALRGLQAQGVSCHVTSSRIRVSGGLPILLGTTLWREIEATGPFLLVDRCSFGDPTHCVSLVRDGHGRRGDHRVPERLTGERWETHGQPVIPWRADSREIVLCGQTRTYSPHFRRPDDWYAKVAGACTHYRPHPASRPHSVIGADKRGLPESSNWQDCGLAVTLNSSVGVEAVLAGIPTVTMDEGSMAWDVTGHDVASPQTPDRTSWLHWLAWTQWSHNELEEGSPWLRYLD